MAEETPPGGPTGGPRRFKSVNVERANVGHVQVQRLRVGGDPKRAETDILQGIKRILDRGVARIENALGEIELALRKNQENNRKALKDLGDNLYAAMKGTKPSSGGGGDTDISKAIDKLGTIIESMSARMSEVAPMHGAGGEGGTTQHGHADVSGVKGVEAQFKSVRRILRNLEKDIKGVTHVQLASLQDMYQLTKSGVITQFGNNLRDVNVAMNNFAMRMTDSRNITRFVTDKFNTYMRLSASGLADFADVFLTDFAPALFKGRDNLKDTLDTVRKRMESGLISPIGLVGEEITDVARNLRAARGQLDERFNFDVFQRMGFKEANEAMVALYDAQRRQNVNADINRIDTQRNMVGQLKMLDLIAQNTGKTVEELVRATQQDKRSLAELVRAGIITMDRAQSVGQMIDVLKGQGQEGIANILMDVIRKGGRVEQYLGKNTEVAGGLAASGQIDTLRQLVGLSQSGLGQEDLAEATGRVTRQFGQNPFLGGVGGEIYGQDLQKIFGEGNIGRTDFQDLRGADKDRVGGWFRWLGDVIRNVIPRSSMLLVGALAANTFALFANTAALTKGGFFGTFGKFGRGAKVMMGKGGRMMGRMGGALGGLGGGIAGMMGTAGGSLMKAGGSLGKAAGKLGKIGLGSILKKIPLLGLIAGGVLGLSRAAEGDWLGAAGELASGAARTIPGLGTAASLGIDGLLAARDFGAFDGTKLATPRMSPTTSAPAPRRGERIVELMTQNNRLLDDIKGLLDKGNRIGEAIQSNTSRLGRVGDRRIFDKVTRLFRGDEPAQPVHHYPRRR